MTDQGALLTPQAMNTETPILGAPGCYHFVITAIILGKIYVLATVLSTGKHWISLHKCSEVNVT